MIEVHIKSSTKEFFIKSLKQIKWFSIYLLAILSVFFEMAILPLRLTVLVIHYSKVNLQNTLMELLFPLTAYISKKYVI